MRRAIDAEGLGHREWAPSAEPERAWGDMDELVPPPPVRPQVEARRLIPGKQTLVEATFGCGLGWDGAACGVPGKQTLVEVMFGARARRAVEPPPGKPTLARLREAHARAPRRSGR